MKKHVRAKKSFWKMGWIAAASLVWLIIRTGSKPSRITYPCQKAAVANINIFLLGLFGPALAFGKIRTAFSRILDNRFTTPALLIGTLLLFAFGSFAFTPSNSIISSSIPVSINIPTRTSVSSSDSALFYIENASGSQGNMDNAILSLVNLMANHNLYFYNTASQPSGLIGKNDVVIIKVNSEWAQRGSTNTDLIKAIIQKIVSHPDGFTGEVVIADNGQWTDRTSDSDVRGYDYALGTLTTATNSYDHVQSLLTVANYFKNLGYHVSVKIWDYLSTVSVGEYSAGDMKDGYVVGVTDSNTGLVSSYPKWETPYGTYISLKDGVWTGSSYDSGRLKVINVPVLKSHSTYGVSACIKNYMGVQSQPLSGGHGLIGAGGMGAEMADSRFPTLNILDCIYVNAVPTESGSVNAGPNTPYTAASYTNIIGASQDPVALDYYSAKYILMPAAKAQGYTSCNSLNPDYMSTVPQLQANQGYSFGGYLTNSMNELLRSGYSVTKNESQMNVYVRPRYVNSPDINGDGRVGLDDLLILAKAYGSTPGAPNWNPKADIDGDGIVGLTDLFALAQNYGQRIS